MRIYGLATAAAVFLALGADASAQPSGVPENEGTYEYAGETCFWASYEKDRIITMRHHEYNGQIVIPPAITGGFSPYHWTVVHPDGHSDLKTDFNAKSALNRLCGAMIVARDKARQAALYNENSAFRALLDALEPSQ